MKLTPGSFYFFSELWGELQREWGMWAGMAKMTWRTCRPSIHPEWQQGHLSKWWWASYLHMLPCCGEIRPAWFFCVEHQKQCFKMRLVSCHPVSCMYQPRQLFSFFFLRNKPEKYKPYNFSRAMINYVIKLIKHISGWQAPNLLVWIEVKPNKTTGNSD